MELYIVFGVPAYNLHHPTPVFAYTSEQISSEEGREYVFAQLQEARKNNIHTHTISIPIDKLKLDESFYAEFPSLTKDFNLPKDFRFS